MERINIVIDNPTGDKALTAEAAKVSAELNLYGAKPPVWPSAFAQIGVYTRREWSASEVKFALDGVADGLRAARIIKQTGVVIIESVKHRRMESRDFITITLTKNKP